MPHQLKTLTVTAGVASTVDFTPQSTPHYTYADKIRFTDGFPEKIGGWTSLSLNSPFPLNGVARSVYSYIYSGLVYYIVATHTNLYRIIGNSVFNATPVVTTPVALNNVMGTTYGTLVNNPFAVVAGTPKVTVTDAGHPFMSGDVLTFSGATGFGGVPAGDLNTTKIIGEVTANTYTFTIATTPTSTASGGGASVVRASRIVRVNHTNSGLTDGDNVVIADLASAVGGITQAQINGIRRVRTVTNTGYYIEADGVATSSVSNAGGTVNIYPEIPNGQQNPTTGVGYGMGLYGVGLYGVAKTSSSPTPPTIWSFDRFGDLVVMNAGNQTGLYSWNNSVNTLPALVANAPTALNYTFVTDNIAVTLGANGAPNRVKWSDQSNLTVWTATAQNQAGEDDIEGAGQFISHAPLRTWNLLFTTTAVYTLRYIGKPFVFEIKPLDMSRGLIAQNARVVVNGIAYWMGKDNFYMYRGANVEIIPSNTNPESTLKNWVFDNLNVANASKIFAWYNSEFSEIWWHYPSVSATEPDRIARFNILDNSWVMDTMDRTAAEYPTPLSYTPYLTAYNGTTTIYQHENGYDNDGDPLPFVLDTPYFMTGDMSTTTLGGLYPDNMLSTGSLGITLNTKLYPNQTPDSVTFSVPNGAQNLIYLRRGRYWQYRIFGSDLGQYWRAGLWQEQFKRSGKR